MLLSAINMHQNGYTSYNNHFWGDIFAGLAALRNGGMAAFLGGEDKTVEEVYKTNHRQFIS